MHLNVVCLNESSRELYNNHGTFHEGDSGLDLFIVEDATIKAGATECLKLGIKAAAFSHGKNVSYMILPRSSISKTPLRLANSIGLIDSGYRGELRAAVDNIKTEDFTVKKGERLFQAVSFTGEEISFEIVETLDATSRGEGGFGSTSNPVDTTPAEVPAAESSPTHKVAA